LIYTFRQLLLHAAFFIFALPDDAAFIAVFAEAAAASAAADICPLSLYAAELISLSPLQATPPLRRIFAAAAIAADYAIITADAAAMLSLAFTMPHDLFVLPPPAAAIAAIFSLSHAIDYGFAIDIYQLRFRQRGYAMPAYASYAAAAIATAHADFPLITFSG